MTRLKMVGVAAALGALTMLTLAGPAGAAPQKNLTTSCTGVITDLGPTHATFTIDGGEACAVWDNKKGQGGKLLNRVTYQFTNRGDVAGGAPRFSIPINDGSFDPNTDYAFIDAAGCEGTSGVPVLVSTQNPACNVHHKNVDYANWTAFWQANPTYKTASGWVPFIIADSLPGDPTRTYRMTDIFFG